MENIKEKILRFGTLSAEEQQDVEAYVDAHPEWRALLEEIKALDEMSREAQLLQRVDDEALAYYVVAQHTGLGGSIALRQFFDDLEVRLADDPVLRARYDALMSRLKTFASSLDPAAHFEELTGFPVASLKDLSVEDATRAPVHGKREETASSPSIREALVFSLPRAFRWAVAAVVLAVLAYGGLFAISQAVQSDAERLALVDLSETQIEGYDLTLRGAQSTMDSTSTDALYLRALRTLRDAKTTTLGLFPRYDRQRLAQAEQLLQRVIEREESGSFLKVEAHFFLGKIYLAQGKIEEARSNFQTVAICEGPHASEAVEILTRLQEKYPAHGQGYLG